MCLRTRLHCTRSQDRNKLLDSAAKSGLVTNYEGWRVSLKGMRFKLKNVTLFNVTGKLPAPLL